MCLVIKYPISACRKRRSVLRSPLVTCNKLIGIPSFVCIDVGEPMHAPRGPIHTATVARCALSVSTAVHLHRRLATIGAAGSVPFSSSPRALTGMRFVLWIPIGCVKLIGFSHSSARWEVKIQQRERKSAYLIWQQAGVADGEHHETCNKQTALVNNFKSSRLKNDISEVDLNMQLHVKSSNFLSCYLWTARSVYFSCILRILYIYLHADFKYARLISVLNCTPDSAIVKLR